MYIIKTVGKSGRDFYFSADTQESKIGLSFDRSEAYKMSSHLVASLVAEILTTKLDFKFEVVLVA